MSARYEITGLRKKKDNKRIYKNIIYPKINYSDMDIYVQVKETDRLDLLAIEYYGDSSKWWIIAHANKIKGSLYVPVETILRIPMNIEKIMNDLRKLNEE